MALLLHYLCALLSVSVLISTSFHGFSFGCLCLASFRWNLSCYLTFYSLLFSSSIIYSHYSRGLVLAYKPSIYSNLNDGFSFQGFFSSDLQTGSIFAPKGEEHGVHDHNF
ncbi:hypothetical protein BJX63DRAFT_203410 [Aspergillus granulosus]|uniref:Uncharacterized protein n=1 Tax=Aspergillus granulosus TaxID=176169 RepID=A0ABR4HFR3_9EURO